MYIEEHTFVVVVFLFSHIMSTLAATYTLPCTNIIMDYMCDMDALFGISKQHILIRKLLGNDDTTTAYL